MSLLTKKQLGAELGMVPTAIQALCRERKIPVIRLSRKMVRFDLARVRAALLRFEVKAID